MLLCTKCKHKTSECTCTDEKLEWQKRMHEEYKHRVESYNCVLRNEGEESVLFKMERDRLARAEKHYYEATYEDYYSVEIDDDIVDTILTLWSKGYVTEYCCAGHPEKDDIYDFYVSFHPKTFFDFTKFHFGPEWTYIRGALRFSYTYKRACELLDNGVDLLEHLKEGRKFLQYWAENLPECTWRHGKERNIGVGPGGRLPK